MEKINNPKAFVGRKCKGFKFENEWGLIGFDEEMEEYIGEVGIIKRYQPVNNSYSIQFPDDYWNYPADERIFDNLID